MRTNSSTVPPATNRRDERMREIGGGDSRVSTWNVVRVGDDPEPFEFEPADPLRDGIHAYVVRVVELIEKAVEAHRR